MPPAFWRAGRRADTLLVGTNRVLCFRALRGVRWDALVIRDTYRALWHDQRIGALYHERLWKPEDAWKVGPADRRVTHCDEFVRFLSGWQHRRALDANGEAAVMANPSVVLMAANWAWLLGARELLLVGVDYREGMPEMVAPFAGSPDGWVGRYRPPPPPRVENAFRRAVDAVTDLGGSIVNLSPGTRLNAVPTGKWDANRHRL